MKANKRWRHAAALLLALLVCVSVTAVTAFAHGEIDTARSSSLSVYFGHAGVGFPGAEFSIYRVASVSQSGRFTLEGGFSGYPVNVNGLSSSEWRALAQTLAAYAARDGLSPAYESETNAAGYAGFYGLEPGLYLVTGERYTSDGYVYTPESILVSLPSLTGDGEWDYDVSVSCKYDRDPATTGTVTLRVEKVWNDGANRYSRPENVTVQLLKNGAVADTVVLSDANGWEYAWNGLDAGAVWQVVEYDVPDGYTVSIEREGITFVITNAYTDEAPEPTPAPSAQPSMPPDATPSPSDTPGTLPQTGMLWWPVPLLICCGLLLILAGFLIRRKQGNGK